MSRLSSAAEPFEARSTTPTVDVVPHAYYEFRRSAKSPSDLLEILDELDNDGVDYINDVTTKRKILECAYEIVRRTFVAIAHDWDELDEDEIDVSLIIARGHCEGLPKCYIRAKETRQRDSILAFNKAVRDLDDINRLDLSGGPTKETERRMGLITINVHKAFVQAELEVYGKLSKDIRPRLLRNALSCIVAASLKKGRSAYEIRHAAANAIATIAGAEVGTYEVSKARLLELLRSEKSSSKRRKIGHRFVANEVPMPKDADMSPEDEKETEAGGLDIADLQAAEALVAFSERQFKRTSTVRYFSEAQCDFDLGVSEGEGLLH